MSSKDSNEKQLVHSKTHNRELMFGLDMEEIMEDFFDLLVQRYELGLEQSIMGRNFVFELCLRWITLQMS